MASLIRLLMVLASEGVDGFLVCEFLEVGTVGGELSNVPPPKGPADPTRRS